jgi:hypothetical protein
MTYKLAVLALALGAAGAVQAQKALPNDAPPGKRWVVCQMKFMPGFTVLYAGQYLMDYDDSKRSETNEAIKNKFLAEYLPKLAADQPGIKGKLDHTNCNGFRSRGEWAAFSEGVKQRRNPRTEFVPTFAKGYVSSKEHIDRN